MTIIRFTDGTQSIHLTGNWVVLDFGLPTPETKGSDTDDPTTAGGERFNTAWRNVQQVTEVMFTGSYAEFVPVITTLENMFNRAAERQSNPGLPRVFIERQVVHGGEWYRSEILFGRVDYDPSLLHFPWPNKHIRFYIGVRRRYFWEDATQRQIPLATTGVAKTTNAIPLWNHTDSGQTNFVDVAAADIQGTLPAPVTVYMINSTGGSTPSTGFVLARNVNANPTTFNHIIEAETLIVGTQVPGSADNVNYSAGYGRQITIASGGAVTLPVTLSTSFLEKAAAQYFHVLLRVNHDVNPNKLMWSTMKVYLGGVTLLWEGSKLFWTNGWKLVDLGVIPLPPWLSELPRSQDLQLHITLGHAAGSNQDYIIDYIEFLAVDSWMVLDQRGWLLENNARVVYDANIDRVYGYDTVNDRYANVWTRFGGAPTVHPNMNQRFYFHHLINYAAPLNSSFSLQMYYRPRRLTL